MVSELFVPEDRWLDLGLEAMHHFREHKLPKDCDAVLGITREMAMFNLLQAPPGGEGWASEVRGEEEA